MLTYSNPPVTFLTGSSIEPDKLTEVQDLLYKALCKSNPSDACTVQMLKYTASAMFKKQINMSDDLLAGHDVGKVYQSKLADTNAAERSFGGKDNRLRMCPTETEMVTDGILCWKFNKVSNTLEQFTTAEIKKMVEAFMKTKFKQNMQGRCNKRKQDRIDYAAEDLATRCERGEKTFAKRAKTLDGGGDALWTPEDIQLHVSTLPSKKLQLQAMGKQWQGIKAFVKLADPHIKWPDKFKQMPKDAAVLKATLILVLEEKELMAGAREAKRKDDAQRVEEQETGVRAVEDPLNKILPTAVVDRDVLNKRMSDQVSAGTHGERSKKLRTQQKERAHKQEEQEQGNDEQEEQEQEQGNDEREEQDDDEDLQD